MPHGYDGQGPEHSSGRIERFLQLCNEDPRVFPSPDKIDRQHQDCNMQVVYCTTPANVFHVLRRQIHREFRKPLIFFFSKSLLRHPLAKSHLAEFTGGHFRRVIADTAHDQDTFKIKPKEEIKRLVLCSGQVWAALHKERESHKVDGIPSSYKNNVDVAIIRIEQLHPFPFVTVKNNIESYPNLESIVWAQEEHLNAGGWTFVQPRLQTLLRETKYPRMDVTYAGRGPCASPATGNKYLHKREEKMLLKEALGLPFDEE
jgi:2-oxoglutarate dehydrogenase E1 component